MTGIEKFEKFLERKQNYIKTMIGILPNGSLEQNFLRRELDLLGDIIHHFEIFVKGDSETDV